MTQQKHSLTVNVSLADLGIIPMGLRSYLISSLLLMTSLVSSEAFAKVGKITVDGVEVPAVLFRAYEASPYVPLDLCHSDNDAYVRDTVLNQWLLVQDAKSRNLKLPERDAGAVKKLEDKLKLYMSDGRGNSRQSDEIESELFRTMLRSYQKAMHREPTRKELIEEYRQRINDKDPALVDTTVFRMSRVTLNTIKDGETFEARIKLGTDIADALEGLEQAHWNPERRVQWRPNDSANFRNFYKGDITSLKSGDILGPYNEKGAFNDKVRALYFIVHETKQLRRIRPKQKIYGQAGWAIKGYSKHTFIRANTLLHTQARLVGRDIRENGKTILVTTKYQDCATK